MKRQTPFEKWYYSYGLHIKDQIDEVDLVESLSKTKFKLGKWWFKCVFDIGEDRNILMDYKTFDDVSELIGFIFDKCSVGNYHVHHVYYEKDRGLLSVFLLKRE